MTGIALSLCVIIVALSIRLAMLAKKQAELIFDNVDLNRRLKAVNIENSHLREMSEERAKLLRKEIKKRDEFISEHTNPTDRRDALNGLLES